MPALVPSYEQGARGRRAEVGKLLAKIARRQGHRHRELDLAGRRRRQPRARRSSQPDDAKGLKVRGGSREMDMMLKAAGASVITLPSNEIYAAMQTGAMDAAMTSSTSLISFRLEEIAKALTTGRGKAYWFMFEPLMMSKEVFDKLPQGAAGHRSWRSGAEHGEVRASTRPRPTTRSSPTSTPRPAPRCATSTRRPFDKWQAIARDTAWKDYAEQDETAAALAQSWRRSCC